MNEKPICLRLEDAKAEIARVINRQRENGIPFYLLEPILKDYYTQVVNGKNAEVEAMRREYEASREGNEDDGLGTREETDRG